MHDERFEFKLARSVSIEDAELTLGLAQLAAEALHGESGVTLGIDHQVQRKRRVITVEPHDEAGFAVLKLFTTFLRREFGAKSFVVTRRPALAGSRLTSYT